MRRRENSEMTGGEDSLLDVIANLVGVLIILVAIASASARSSLIEQIVQDSPEPDELARVQASHDEVRDRADKTEAGYRELEMQLAISNEANRRLAELRLSGLVARETALKKLHETSTDGDPNVASITDRKLELARLQSQLTRLNQKLSAQKTQAAPTEKIVHYPTPIAKTVFSDEIHFRLADGRIEFVPIESLMDRMKTQWKNQAATLRAGGEIEDRVGPLDGFQMHYRLGTRIQVMPGAGESISVELMHFDVSPTDPNIGEPVESAMQDGSRFATRLQRLQAERTTVSVWVYPDSFDEYMQLRDYLRQRGFQTAAWPIEFGQLISGGPDGMRTTAH